MCVFLGTVSSVTCPPICSTSCISSCAPSCCYSGAPAPAPLYGTPPCVPTPLNPCPPPQAAAPTPQPRQSKVNAKRPASKCNPATGACATTSLYPFPAPAYPQFPAPSPCIPTLANNWCRSNVLAKPPAVNRFIRRPVTYRYPLRPYRSNMPKMVSAKPVSRAVLPMPQAGGYGGFNPCAQPPCPPMMMPPPPPPQPMMMPQYPMQQASNNYNFRCKATPQYYRQISEIDRTQKQCFLLISVMS